MKTVQVTSVANPLMRAASSPIASTRVTFLDNLRYLMVLLVIVYHAVAAYARVALHWIVHDTNTLAVDIVRELFDGS